MFLEMSRDAVHGGGAWAFSKCIWAPTEKTDGTKWPFWAKILDVRAGDLVLHLKGIPPTASFVGYSIASTNGFQTSERPPDPKGWSYASSFFRADLADYTPFDQPIALSKVFRERKTELETYFDTNKARGPFRQNIFYTRQSGRLQCLNGAYLSDIDNELFFSLFGTASPSSRSETNLVSIQTAAQLSIVQTRLGQSAFSKEVKKLYKHTCCFPMCGVSDDRFLIGSHIARWSDNETLRGHLGNGLCLCLMHDKAFELGLFTLDKNYRIFVNPNTRIAKSAFVMDLANAHGHMIELTSVQPLKEALIEHWTRANVNPTVSDE